MTLPASGPISLSQVNTELIRSSTALIDMNDSAVRTLANVGGSGTVISMQDLLGKAFTLAIQGPGGAFEAEQDTQTLDCAVKLVISPNGIISLFKGVSSSFTINTPDSAINTPFTSGPINVPTAWCTPLINNIGIHFEVNYSGEFSVDGSDSVLRLFGDSFVGDQPLQSITTAFHSLSVERTITMLATGGDAAIGLSVLGKLSGTNNGLINIRRVGTTTPVASIIIRSLSAAKDGD